jgi:hypothetical protein
MDRLRRVTIYASQFYTTQLTYFKLLYIAHKHMEKHKLETPSTTGCTDIGPHTSQIELPSICLQSLLYITGCIEILFHRRLGIL